LRLFAGGVGGEAAGGGAPRLVKAAAAGPVSEEPYPGGTTPPVAHTLQRYYASLPQLHTTAPFKDVMLDFDQLNVLIGTPELLALGKTYEGGSA